MLMIVYTSLVKGVNEILALRLLQGCCRLKAYDRNFAQMWVKRLEWLMRLSLRFKKCDRLFPDDGLLVVMIH
jgi:hypothetical protein